jgi:hypothetical protein
LISFSGPCRAAASKNRNADDNGDFWKSWGEVFLFDVQLTSIAASDFTFVPKAPLSSGPLGTGADLIHAIHNGPHRYAESPAM